MDITVKDGKYRIQLYDFGEFEWSAHLAMSDKDWDTFGLGKLYTKQARKGRDPGRIFFKTIHESNINFMDMVEKAMSARQTDDL